MVCEGHGWAQMVTDGYERVQMSILGRGDTKRRQDGPRMGAEGQKQTHSGQAKIASGTGTHTTSTEVNGGESGELRVMKMTALAARGSQEREHTKKRAQKPQERAQT